MFLYIPILFTPSFAIVCLHRIPRRIEIKGDTDLKRVGHSLKIFNIKFIFKSNAHEIDILIIHHSKNISKKHCGGDKNRVYLTLLLITINEENGTLWIDCSKHTIKIEPQSE